LTRSDFWLLGSFFGRVRRDALPTGEDEDQKPILRGAPQRFSF
jgi:hypothetical protein